MATNEKIGPRLLIKRTPCGKLTERGYVYVAQCWRTRLIKVGRAQSPTLRVKELQTGCPFKIILCGYFPETEALQEGDLHEAFQEYQCHGEWFALAPDVEFTLKSLGIQCDQTFFPGYHDDSYGQFLDDWNRATPPEVAERERERNRLEYEQALAEGSVTEAEMAGMPC